MTMNSYDGAELCELLGLYLVDLLNKEFGKQNIIIYGDDGLSFFENISGPDADKIKKTLFTTFKSNGLSITRECSFIVTDFLDVTFDLKSATISIENQTMNSCISINIPTTLHQQLIKFHQ